MSVKTTLAIATFSIFAAGSVFASEGTRAFEDQVLSTQSRAEVVAQLQAAQRAGAIPRGEGLGAPVAQSTLSRAQVVAEAREAQRLGLLGGGEVLSFATPAQAEQIQMAGERAVAVQLAGKR